MIKPPIKNIKDNSHKSDLIYGILLSSIITISLIVVFYVILK